MRILIKIYGVLFIIVTPFALYRKTEDILITILFSSFFGLLGIAIMIAFDGLIEDKDN